LIISIGIVFFIPEKYATVIIGFVGIVIGGLFTLILQSANLSTQFENNLRLAALEKRLQAHQEAYSHWISLINNLFDEKKIRDSVYMCQEWWVNNCIYLTPEASSAFRTAYFSALGHTAYLSMHDSKLVEMNAKSIFDAGNIILEGVSLPPIAKEKLQINDKKE